MESDWRQWLPYWQNFAKEEQDLLDFVARELPEPVGYDKYDKYVNFIDAAYREKMITKGEYNLVNDLYKVCNP